MESRPPLEAAEASASTPVPAAAGDPAGRSMGVRARLALSVMLAMGTSLCLSVVVLVTIDRRDEREASVARADEFLETLSLPLSIALADHRDAEVERIVGARSTRADLFGITDVAIVDENGDFVTRASKIPPRFAKAAAGSDEPLRDGVIHSMSTLISRPLPAMRAPDGTPAARMTLVAKLSDQTLTAQLQQRHTRVLLAFFSVASLGLALLLLSLSEEVVQPLKELAKLASGLARGDLEARAVPRGGRELRTLALALNDAAEKLAERQDALESEVLRRTEDLAHANVELSTMNQRLQKLALTDPLTGLFNRRAFEQALALEVTRQTRSRRPFALLMIDVDNFKHYNDKNGHPAGDDVLRCIATTMAASLRASDLIARYGGEEFVLLLLDTPLAGGADVGEKVRQSVATTEFPHGEAQPLGRLTVSVGVAAWPDHGVSDAEVLAAADAALYTSKRNGRDRVTLAPPPAGAAPTPTASTSA